MAKHRKQYFQVLPRGTIQAAKPGEGQYKAWCPKCDRAVIAGTSILRCPYDGQLYCPPTQPRTFQ